MNQPSPTPGIRPARAFRYLYRVPLLLWHLAIDLPVILLLMLPPIGGIDIRGERLEHRVIRAWSAGLMRIFGFRLHRNGVPLSGPAVFVAPKHNQCHLKRKKAFEIN